MAKNKYRYQSEYETSVCFWGTSPAKYVQLLAQHLNNNLEGVRVLDIGAGEGKNAVYLASLGAHVLATDISELALNRFKMQPGYPSCASRIDRFVANANNLWFRAEEFDIVIAYGLFHCLDTINEIEALANQIKWWTRTLGYFVGCTLTDEIPPPAIQPYLEDATFPDKDSVLKLFKEWKIVSFENDTILETHPTSNIAHEHSLCRIMAQKP